MSDSTALPSADTFFNAIDIYLAHAYGIGAAIPKPVAARVEQVKLAGKWWESAAMEGDAKRRMLRLGNKFYPHMKMAVEERPDHLGYLFRADTHDRHVRPAPGSKEEAAFKELMARNLAVSQAIEAGWNAAGVPTFRAYLKEDLARRKSG